MATTSSDRLQQIGTVFAIVLGVWGAGLSTYQELRSREKEKPRVFAQLTISRPDYVETIKSRPVTFLVKVHNSGQTPITFLPSVSFVASNPGSGFANTFNGQFSSEASFSLPKTLQPGEQATALATATESDSVFGPNMQYAVLMQSTDGQIYFVESIAGPIKTAEAYEALQKHVKYQAKVEFGSKPAIALPR
jgi:hypothetical protein